MGCKLIQILFLKWILLFFCNCDEIVTKCNKNCEREVRFSEKEDLFCNKECKSTQCFSGCSQYYIAVNSSCHSVCKQYGTSEFRNLQQTERQFCTHGCSFALSTYTETIKAVLGTPPAPGLKHSSRKGSSFLTLHWSGPISDNVTYYIQGRSLDTNSDWLSYGSTFQGNGDIEITGLQPFMNYTFRVSMVITTTDVLYTPQSEIIATLSSGVPSSPPTILEISAPTSSVISLRWRAPVFTNGPLLSYRLYLKPVHNDILHDISIEVPPNITTWTFRQLEPSQWYLVELTARNKFGEGLADSTNMTTPKADETKKADVFLILAEYNKLIRQDLSDIWAPRDTLRKFGDSNQIKVIFPSEIDKPINGDHHPVFYGVALHLPKKIILISDNEKKVHRFKMEDKTLTENVYPVISHPGAIAIDWLHNFTYIVDGLMIKRCDVDRPSCILATGTLDIQPDVLQVDPVNGFLFFNQRDVGLCAIDIGDITPERPAAQFLIVRHTIKAFAIDLNNMVLYFPNASANTIVSTSYDGTQLKEVRRGQNYRDIKSMAYHANRFFLTDGSTFLYEEFNADTRMYYLNRIQYGSQCSSFNVDQKTAQPHPVPHDSPRNVRALFTDSKVVIQWQQPGFLPYQGRGSYQSWYYEVNVHTDDDSSLDVSEKITGTYYERQDLVPDAAYHIKVRAWSQSGFGPWSDVFLGRTLSTEASTAKVIVAATQNLFSTILYEMDMEGRSQSELTSINSLGEEIIDLSCAGEKIIWVSDSNEVHMYDRSTGDRSGIYHISYATSVAYDWLGQKLYWSNPKQNVISRSDFNGENPEFVIQGTARHMAIDAIQGRIYWVTSNSVEASYLNGDDHVVYFSLPYFCGKHVISLTLNFDHRKVLWYVKSFERQELYMSELLGDGITQEQLTVEPLGSFHSISKFSVLEYFSHRLFWQNEKGSIVVGDLECNYTSEITSEPVMVFTVSHPSLHPFPPGRDKTSLHIIPSKIPNSSIQCQGHWSKFNLTWERSEVNHGRIFYEVSIQIHDSEGKSFAMQTTNNLIEMSNISAYTQLTVNIRAYTYWGYGPVTIATVYSPMSVPSKPLTPRVYITQHKESFTSENSFAADFRWTLPEHLNGIIVQFVVHSWMTGDESNKNETTLAQTYRHFNLPCLQPGTTYFFKVSACTKIGCGPSSDVVASQADDVNPVPKLLAVSSSQLFTEEIDSVGNRTVVLEHMPPPVAVTYLAQDNVMFWVDQNNVLLKGNKKSKKQLLLLSGPVTDMTMDWISRTLYIVETNPEQQRSSIVVFPVDQGTKSTLMTRAGVMKSIVTDPHTSTILWTEQTSTSYYGMYKLGPDAAIQPVFTNQRRRRSTKLCNCNPKPGSSIAVDHSHDLKNEILFYDMSTEAIVAADMEGCMCRQVIQKEVDDNKGLPPSLLTVDHTNIYWYSNDRLYIMDKLSGTVTYKDLADIVDMVAYGAHLQSLPSTECLYPDPYTETVSVLDITNQTATVALESIAWPSACSSISHPHTKYTVYYQAGTDPCGKDCLSQTSYNSQVTVTDLKPYTDYVFHGAVSNYYTDYLAKALGPPRVFKTKIGVPEKAVITSVKRRNPEEIEVTWLPPNVTNGPEDELVYIIQWSTVTSKGLTQNQEEVNVSQVTDIYNKDVYKKALNNLLPGHQYTIQILTSNAARKIFNVSDPMAVQTFEKPRDITLESATKSSLTVNWTSPSETDSVWVHKFQVQKCPYGGTSYMDKADGTLETTKTDTEYNNTFSNLEPSTDYCFTIVIHYIDGHGGGGNYLWTGHQSFIYRTLSSIPGPPDPPEVDPMSSGYDVKWQEPNDNGASITNYILQYWDSPQQVWSEVFNGSGTHWVVDDAVIPRGSDYVFRVAAENAHGLGPFSLNSTAFTFVKLPQSAADDTVAIVSITLSFLFVFLLIVLMSVCYVIKKRNRKNRKPKEFIIRGRDTELAVLRELPLQSQENNTIYAINIVPTDSEIANLNHLCRDQLILTKFLGSGAFGEVFEGVVKSLNGENCPETRIAVKTLRKSATDQEKEEFLKEAVLMNNFRHEHILDLIGVCLDNDPEFIILELMEGGDLLSYLRFCRASTSPSNMLTLTDLVKICVHVASGCKYLEEMHFVHRDLAARNCLVSSRNVSDIVVKIGDFGLARDIYKNDYYRKEGEGLLPVRWMSPESLVDGVFTVYSDIWAFGVLMWEVMTYGHQPYQARTNIEVLHFVRSGGILEQPENCPEEIFVLMNTCWNYDAEERPHFPQLLEQLEQFYDKCVSLFADYIVPVRTRPVEVGGYHDNSNMLTTRTNQIMISSHGHDTDHEPIYRVTSFDSPEPSDAYIEPQTAGTPVYLEILQDDQPQHPNSRKVSQSSQKYMTMKSLSDTHQLSTNSKDDDLQGENIETDGNVMKNDVRQISQESSESQSHGYYDMKVTQPSGNGPVYTTVVKVKQGDRGADGQRRNSARKTSNNSWAGKPSVSSENNRKISTSCDDTRTSSINGENTRTSSVNGENNRKVSTNSENRSTLSTNSENTRKCPIQGENENVEQEHDDLDRASQVSGQARILSVDSGRTTLSSENGGQSLPPHSDSRRTSVSSEASQISVFSRSNSNQSHDSDLSNQMDHYKQKNIINQLGSQRDYQNQTLISAQKVPQEHSQLNSDNYRNYCGVNDQRHHCHPHNQHLNADLERTSHDQQTFQYIPHHNQVINDQNQKHHLALVDQRTNYVHQNGRHHYIKHSNHVHHQNLNHRINNHYHKNHAHFQSGHVPANPRPFKIATVRSPVCVQMNARTLNVSDLNQNLLPTGQFDPMDHVRQYCRSVVINGEVPRGNGYNYEEVEREAAYNKDSPPPYPQRMAYEELGVTDV